MVAEDGSVFAPDGRMVFCSVERFVRDICEGDCCFVCGRSERAVEFNREHILPNWVLHRFDLHGETVTLPNGERHRYGTYTLPCCVDCNTDMSRVFETPISEAFAGGFDAVLAMVRDGCADLLFRWMALIFLKYHLKDRLLRRHLDPRKGKEMISAGYEWELFHHLHSLARSHHTGAVLGQHVIGTLILRRRDERDGEGPFDASTVTDASTIYLQLGDTQLFAVLNDAKASAGALEQLLGRIDGPINTVQGRELTAELAAANLHLENRPRFSTVISGRDGSGLIIRAEVEGGPRFVEQDQELVGFVKCGLLQHYFGQVPGMSAGEIEHQMRANHFTFLWDAEGRFVGNGAARAGN